MTLQALIMACMMSQSRDDRDGVRDKERFDGPDFFNEGLNPVMTGRAFATVTVAPRRCFNWHTSQSRDDREGVRDHRQRPASVEGDGVSIS